DASSSGFSPLSLHDALPISFSSSSAYAVMRKNHCSSSRATTVVPQRQQAPSTTCSLASTVSSTGHQLTVERRRYASPRSNIRRKIGRAHAELQSPCNLVCRL